MDLKLKDRVVVITGPAKGMGAAITRAFAAEGSKLALLGRDIAAIEPVAAEARAAGVEVIVIACDITSGAACDAAWRKPGPATADASMFSSMWPAGLGRSARPAGKHRG